MMGAVSFDDQIKAGKATLAGDRRPYEQLKGMLVQFDMGFEILPGTHPDNTEITRHKAYEAVTGNPVAE